MELSLARLIGFCISLTLSVVYTFLFGGALYTLGNKRKSSRISPVITWALVIMFFLNAAQLCLQAADIYLAFFTWKGPGGPTGYFLDYGSKILPARDGIFWLEGIITDTVVCWRLYAIWMRNKYIMVVPITVLCGGLVSGIIMFLYTIRRMVEDNTALIPVIDKWWETTLGFTIAVNIIVPGMIVGRLWWVARKTGLLGSRSARPYKQIALALMESGSLYTVSITAFLGIFLSNSLPALYMGACILPTIVAIVPTLIILRINSFKQSHDITALETSERSPPHSSRRQPTVVLYEETTVSNFSMRYTGTDVGTEATDTTYDRRSPRSMSMQSKTEELIDDASERYA